MGVRGNALTKARCRDGEEQTITPASSGDHARKVILLLLSIVSADVASSIAREKTSIPLTLAGSEAVLEVVDGVAGTLANGALCETSAPKLPDCLFTVPGPTYSLGLGGGVDQLLAEDLPVGVVRSLLDDNLAVVVRELENNVLVLLIQLEVVVRRDALLRDGRSVGRRTLVSRLVARWVKQHRNAGRRQRASSGKTRRAASMWK